MITGERDKNSFESFLGRGQETVVKSDKISYFQMIPLIKYQISKKVILFLTA